MYSASHYFSPRRANEESSGLLSVPLRRVHPNRSNTNAPEMIRDVGDNVPPSNGIRRLEFFGLYRPDQVAKLSCESLAC